MATLTNRPHGGFHSTLEHDHPYLFLDSCMQIWPDADFASTHLHGVTAYGVTAFEPHDSFEQAVEQMMFWHLTARRHPNLLVAKSVDDIRQAKRTVGPPSSSSRKAATLSGGSCTASKRCIAWAFGS